MKENESNLETQLCWGITVFDKNDFVESVIERGLGLDQIVKEARAEILYIEARPVRPVGSRDYARFLRALVFFLISEVKVKPEDLSDDEFQILLPLAQHLVDRGHLNPDILELFGE